MYRAGGGVNGGAKEQLYTTQAFERACRIQTNLCTKVVGGHSLAACKANTWECKERLCKHELEGG